MLVRVQPDGALAIGQLSHSWLSGQLARAWGNERFSAPEPREEVVLGAQQHDIGWARFDLEPGFNEQTGLPRAFIELTAEEHLAIWRTAPDQLLSESQYAALVVSLHGRSLSELRARARPEQADALSAHIDAERTRQGKLFRVLGVSADRAHVLQRQMWTWDGLSLALCHGWLPFTSHDVPSEAGLIDIELRGDGERAYTLDPWPFGADRVDVRCEARRLSSRYDSDGEMKAALAAAGPVTLTFSLTPR